METLTSNEIMDRIFTLKDDERIFIHVDPDLCKDMRYTFYKRQGLENLIQSYINNTTETANQLNLEAVADRMAKSLMDQDDKMTQIGHQYLGEDLHNYLQSLDSRHTWTLDFNMRVLIIHNRNTVGGAYESCNCGSGSCSLKHN